MLVPRLNHHHRQQEMAKLILLFAALILGLVFNVLPDWDGTFMTPDPFYFFNFKYGGISYQTYIYMIAEYFIAGIFTWIIAAEETEYRWACQVFFWLVVFDFLDFILSYNSIWFHIGGLPVSMNVLKCFIFGLVILKEWIKDHSQI
jgi:hypothetical protein